MELFVDHVKIIAKAGNGGNGCVSFHREKFVQNGGPDGGDGGNGGDVILYADPNMSTLLDFRFKSKYAAQNGQDGSAGRCVGKRGEDLIIKVPVGTVVREEVTGRIVADMYEAGQKKVLLGGGRGGWGNARFATPTRQAPNFAKPGIQNEVMTFHLELKTIADVGLVGFPNVGKSTILSVVTAAKPKIGNYHFTTLTPNLGILRRHGQDIVLADIPGLVEGASEGVGLGHDFLRHVERTRLLLHVVDISGSEGRDPLDDYEKINLELSNYGELKNRPQILVMNKMDIPGAEENALRMREMLKDSGIQMFEVSGAARQGFDALLDCVARTLLTIPRPEPYAEEEMPALVQDVSAFSVEQEDGVYFVEGPAMERLIGSVNFSDEESMNWFHRSLRRMGVIDALRAAGAKEGDAVVIQEMEFDFVE